MNSNQIISQINNIPNTQQLCFNTDIQKICISVSPIDLYSSTQSLSTQPLSTQLSIGGNAQAGGDIIDNSQNTRVSFR